MNALRWVIGTEDGREAEPGAKEAKLISQRRRKVVSAKGGWILFFVY